MTTTPRQHQASQSRRDQSSRLEKAGRAGTPVQITLNAVLAALEDNEPKVLCVTRGADHLALPYGPFDPREHRTFERGLRDWVARQTRLSLGYVEQLYTFGDRGREGLGRSLDTPIEHLVSVGYLALAGDAAPVDDADARWRSWYRFFPWEDWRAGKPALLSDAILPALDRWTDNRAGTVGDHRRSRVETAFGLNDLGWEEERILERFELMYEAGLVGETPLHESADQKDPPPDADLKARTGLTMASDHRRILATAIARLRGKLKYRPVIFEMMGPTFTLFDLQRAVEAIVGFALHKQNFRRSVESTGLLMRTGSMSDQTGGRPAALFSVNREALRDRADMGLVIPRLGQKLRAPAKS
ncbi:MAG: NAD regulator [Pseudomonadota bacterium]